MADAKPTRGSYSPSGANYIPKAISPGLAGICRPRNGYDRLPAKHNMAGIHITDIEAAINHWRLKNPSPDGVTLPRELRALAEVYGLMVYYKQELADEFTLPLAAAEAWQDWYASTPDTPCIAICSTSQGDETCKGCGRSFEEVQLWTEMSAGEKRAVWRRITVDGTSWRFNRYAERAAEDRQWAKAAADAQSKLDLKAAD